ncbi:MAG: LysR substrate-binding domain-containing protein, partial [Gammaproteobacteria bacterium]|nr:LysR substrate-binding domain-containing protein [Gammaproteobacteria bacterium]
DTNALQSFIAVAETVSFTKAAARVHRTQSAISQQINKLEILLGKRLFVRTKTKTLFLTPEGEIFLGYARQIFALHHEAIDRFKHPELEGEVRFGLPEDFASIYLSDVLADFSRIHPRILLNIQCDFTVNLLSRFKKKEFDLVLVKMNRPEDFPNGLDVWSEPLRWVGDANLIDHQKPLPLVLAPNPCVYRASAIETLEKTSVPWRLVFSSTSYAGTVAAVKAGLGITVMPYTMIPHELHAIDLPLLPKLADAHVSLLKHQANQAPVNSLEQFVLQKLQ